MSSAIKEKTLLALLIGLFFALGCVVAGDLIGYFYPEIWLFVSVKILVYSPLLVWMAFLIMSGLTIGDWWDE